MGRLSQVDEEVFRRSSKHLVFFEARRIFQRLLLSRCLKESVQARRVQTSSGGSGQKNLRFHSPRSI